MALFAFLLAVQLSPATKETPNRQPQLAAGNGIVALTFGAGNAVYFSSSRDGGRSFSTPVKVAEPGKMFLGSRRGPRIAIAGGTIVLSAVAGEKGGGADGDLLAWRSTDGGKSWSGGVRVNDTPGAAREGLHAMASDGKGLVFAAWLDLRSSGTKLYGASSSDGGATWSQNRPIYESPDGYICQCCHPSLAINSRGEIYVMFRNWLGGSRDMYLTRSTDGGRTFEAAQKLGAGTWPLNACPMDGGSLAFDSIGGIVTAWRREETVYVARPGKPEQALGKGKDPSIAATPSGPIVVWKTPDGLFAQMPRGKDPVKITAEGAYAHLAGGDVVVAAWEQRGAITIERLDTNR